MRQPRVFISYSHDTEVHQERVLRLAERLRLDGLCACLDQYVEGTPEEGWPRWMLNKLDEADFVLVVCTETYYRRFRGHEDGGKGRGADWEGATITQGIYDDKSRGVKFVPVILQSDKEDFIPEPLRGQTHYELTSEERYQDLYEFLVGMAGVEPRPLGDLRPVTKRAVDPLTFRSPVGQRVSPTRLRHSADRLFGREAELADLEAAWADSQVHVVTLVGWGGIGKTSLVAKWAAELAARDFDGADYFDWSFYSQGPRGEGAASADLFLTEALRFFDDGTSVGRAESPWDKGARLAELVAARRTLLVLDGLEPLQHRPGPLSGELQDPGMQALVRSLAARNPGLCVLTTRERVADLTAFEGSTVRRRRLDRLSGQAGIELLRFLGVQGARSEMERLVEDLKGHALTLNLIGRFLCAAHGGDVRRRDLVRLEEADAEIQGGHAFRAMEAYETWFKSGGEAERRLLAVLRLLGLFDRPATADCLIALRQPPVISGLTEEVVGLSSAQWNIAVSRLGRCGLVVPDGEALDAHPLVREHFGRRLREENLEAWRAGHSRLFDHLKDTTEHQPASLSGLQPLFQAVGHGCSGGKVDEALHEVLQDRIRTGRDSYTIRKLGAFGAVLSSLACFFERPWDRVSPDLREGCASWLLHTVAYCLQALGRLEEALEPLRTSMTVDLSCEEWKGAAASADGLSGLQLALGDISGAAKTASEAVGFADRSGDDFLRLVLRSTHANCLFQSGKAEDALALFSEAEAMQAEQEVQIPILHSLRGFQFCELLLAPAERAAACGIGSRRLRDLCHKVEQRASTALFMDLASDSSLLDIALGRLTVGRAQLYRAILFGSDLATSKPQIEEAVKRLRESGHRGFLIVGLLTRAWLRSAQGDSVDARADLDEAQEIAERGPMPTRLADINLYRARLFHDRGALVEARRLVEKHSYGRRRDELDDLEAAASSW